MKRDIFKAIIALCTVLFFLCCSKSSSDSSYGNSTQPPSGSSDRNTISIANMSFGPSTTVTKGTTVTWTNNDYTPHTVTADNNSFNSGNLSYGSTFSHTFSNSGTFKYHCSIHTGMTGSVVVK
jgi:plastocyanin